MKFLLRRKHQMKRKKKRNQELLPTLVEILTVGDPNTPLKNAVSCYVCVCVCVNVCEGVPLHVFVHDVHHVLCMMNDHSFPHITTVFKQGITCLFLSYYFKQDIPQTIKAVSASLLPLVFYEPLLEIGGQIEQTQVNKKK